MQAGQPGVSRHLSALARCGARAGPQAGSDDYYRIQPGTRCSKGRWGGAQADEPPSSTCAARRADLSRAVARWAGRSSTSSRSWTCCAPVLDQSGRLWAPSAAHSSRAARGRHRDGTGACPPSWRSPRASWPSTSPKRCCGARRARAKALGLLNVDFVKADLSIPVETASVDAASPPWSCITPPPRGWPAGDPRILKRGGRSSSSTSQPTATSGCAKSKRPVARIHADGPRGAHEQGGSRDEFRWSRRSNG